MSAWSGRRILITGATGLLGSALARRLASLGARVTGWSIADRPWTRLDLEPLPAEATAIERLEIDVTTADLHAALAAANPEIVFHLAARALVEDGLRDPSSVFEVNLGGTARLLDALRVLPESPRTVVASSDKAYGPTEALPYKEEHPLSGWTPYDASKACADHLARCYARCYGLPVVVTRSANLYGPGDCHRSRLVPGTIAALAGGHAPVIRSDGRFRRDYVFVEDAVDAFLAAGNPERPLPAGAVFNLGSGQPVEVLDLVERLARAFPGAPTPVIENRAVAEIRDQWLDSTKAAADLGWKAKTSLDEGLAATVEWYRAHPTTLD